MKKINRSMIKVNIQNKTKLKNIPTQAQFRRWIVTALTAEQILGMVSLCIVTAEESQQLNLLYRQKNKPTNVLAFPYNDEGIVGDLVICAEIVAKEAEEQEKLLEAHWAHLVIHGCLHCLGYDHIEESMRNQMETREISILADLGYANPYEEEMVV